MQKTGELAAWSWSARLVSYGRGVFRLSAAVCLSVITLHLRDRLVLGWSVRLTVQAGLSVICECCWP